MKPTQAFEALDGTLHHSREQAARHDVEVYIGKALQDQVEHIPESARPTYAMIAVQLCEQLANDNALHALFNSSLQATRDDAHAATDVAVGIPMQVEAAEAPPAVCPTCEWQEYCTANQTCHRESSAQLEVANAEVQEQ